MSIKPPVSKVFLWDKRTLYLGSLPDPISLSQGAATLLVSLSGPFYFKTTFMNAPQQGTSLLVPPGANIEVDTADNLIANCNLDPMCEDFYYLSKVMKPVDNSTYVDLSLVAEFKVEYQKLLTEPKSSEDAFALVEHLFSNVKEQVIKTNDVFSTDERIVSVIDLIKKNVDDNLSVETLAKYVDLSEPRLMQLFKEKTGVPIRRYRLWHRLYTTSSKLAEGYNLTEAALLAGFTDSAHFSKTFKDMLGMSPTRILGQPNGIQIIASNQ